MELGRQIVELVGISLLAALIAILAFADGESLFAELFGAACVVACVGAVQRWRKYPPRE